MSVASQVLADGCRFCGADTGTLKAIQLQLAANILLAASPGADVSLEAILDRARDTGICCLTRDQLKSVILRLALQIRGGS